MVEYLIRVGYTEIIEFYKFCERHDINHRYMDNGFGGEHVDTILFSVMLAHKDVMALKLAIPVKCMLTQRI